ncbi:unnamed protein product [Amaranthus hypochondriacus]
MAEVEFSRISLYKLKMLASSEDDERYLLNVQADNLTPTIFHNMDSNYSCISDFEDFSHFYDDNQQPNHYQVVANVLTTAVAENKKKTTFLPKDKKMRQRNRRNNNKGEIIVDKMNKNENINKGVERMTVHDEGGRRDDEYVYLRAKRGQTINSHSLAERVRRQRISDKMKVLQSLVPECEKMTGKVQILDNIINYVHSLQDHVKTLMEELALVDPTFNFNYLTERPVAIQTEESLATSADSECSKIASQSYAGGYDQSICLHESSNAYMSAPLSPWLALLEDREYTI